jgi:DNA-binding NtrC family response regulator
LLSDRQPAHKGAADFPAVEPNNPPSVMTAGRPRIPGRSRIIDEATEHEPAPRPYRAAPLAGSIFLVVRCGDAVSVVDVADGETVSFGRSSDAHIRIDETRVSRRHALLRRIGAAVTIEDLGSRNGTWLNERKLVGEVMQLAGGDVIRVGTAEAVLAVTEGGGANTWREQAESSAVGQPQELSGGIVVADPGMVEVFRVARRLAAMPTTVLVLGETGVGKEVVAEQIHRWSSRAAGPFVRLNCAALPATLLESELFGHERGAFTGADQRKVGYFETARGGTLFLDEVGELTLESQVKLLTVLESRRLRRLGGREDITVDVRVIAATNRDLEQEVLARRFREDLYYRLNAFKLEVPPLRERKVEIALLAELFARAFARNAGVPVAVIGPSASAQLASYSWPGNVRELRNAIEHAVVLADGHIGVEHLPQSLRAQGERVADSVLDSRLADVERRSIVDALAQAGGNQSRAARNLGISRSALIHRMKKHGLA